VCVCANITVPDSLCYVTRYSHDFLAGFQIPSLA
jgi:hypothetical protein